MERIEALIRKLNEQYQQKAGPAQLLGIVQLIQFELTKMQASGGHSLGTAKVAVVLPQAVAINSNAPVQEVNESFPSGYEKYLPKEEKPAIQEVKETLLVDHGTVSVVQKNGQLDMVFDPMTEIPTLSHQPKPRDINNTSDAGESLNDKLRQGKTELVEVLKETPIKDLRKAIGINDRFLFISELFRGDEAMYERSIKTINSFSIYPEAEYWIMRELKVKLGWEKANLAVQHFDQLVRRRFS
jgi:hypothetical protein